jgi:hypothetical protein
MSTLSELQDKLNTAKCKKAIYSYMIETLDAEFLSSLGGPPKKVLLTEEKLKVPVVSIENSIADLTAEVKSLNEEIEKLLNTPLSEATVQ